MGVEDDIAETEDAETDAAEDTRARVRAVVRACGATAAARLLGMPKETVLAVGAEAHCHEGSLVLAKARLDALDCAAPLAEKKR